MRKALYELLWRFTYYEYLIGSGWRRLYFSREEGGRDCYEWVSFNGGIYVTTEMAVAMQRKLDAIQA